MTSRRAWTTRLPIVLLLAACVPGGSAFAAVPYKEIASAGPLTGVQLGDELSCQVSYAGDARLELFPSGAKPGDCGTFVFAASTLFAPNFAAHDSTSTASLGASTPFTPVSQSAVGGAGTGASPFKVTTVADAGASGLRVTQGDSYITGQESYRTDTTIQNVGPALASGLLFRAGDCYLQNSDTGFGFVDPATGAVGCSTNANNSPPSRIEQWYPLTAGATYMQATYSEIWGRIGTHTGFPNTTRATDQIDNGAGISWSFSLAPGASQTFSHYTTFSPTGNAGPPPLPPPPPPPPPAVAPPSGAFGPNGLLDAPPRNTCVSRRYFRIRVRKKFRPILAAVTIKMPKTTRVLRGPPWGTIVDLRGLPRGRFAVKITALTTTATTIKGTRHYRTCRGKLKGGKPPL
jgi:hypothetical protein